MGQQRLALLVVADPGGVARTPHPSLAEGRRQPLHQSRALTVHGPKGICRQGLHLACGDVAVTCQ